MSEKEDLTVGQEYKMNRRQEIRAFTRCLEAIIERGANLDSKIELRTVAGAKNMTVAGRR